MIFLYSDVLYRSGGIETYLHAIALHLQAENIPVRVAVAELEPCPLVDELRDRGIPVYRQPRLPGDRWRIRQHVMLMWLVTQLQPGDWVFCVRQPMPQLYLKMVRWIHRRQAKLAASWMLAPEFLPPSEPERAGFCQAVSQTDAVISVSRCTVHQFKDIYAYSGKVWVVPYHNLLFFDRVVPLPNYPPFKMGFIGRLDREQKNLDILLEAVARAIETRPTLELHLYGRGTSQPELETLARRLKIADRVVFHGAYDHRRDLSQIMANCHFFVYPSRFEGGPCFTLLEMMQAGRFCIASRVGGIPDLYEGFPDIGLLVSPGNVAQLTDAILRGVERLEGDRIDAEAIRDRYFEGFDIASAHQAWMSAIPHHF